MLKDHSIVHMQEQMQETMNDRGVSHKATGACVWLQHINQGLVPRVWMFARLLPTNARVAFISVVC